MIFHIIRKVDRERYTPVVMLPRRGPACDDLDLLNVRYEIWPGHDFELGRKIGSYMLAAARATSFFRRNKIDLIHMNYSCLGWRPAELLAARLLRVPVVEHIHITAHSRYPFFRTAKGLIAVSEFVARTIKGASVPVEVIHNAVDLERLRGTEMRNQLGISHDQVVVGFYGQMRKIKGVEMFVELARRIPNPRVRFLMAGAIRMDQDGAYSLEELNRLISVDPRISYLGYVENIKDIYASTDIVVMPSQWDEPFGLVLIEAGANENAVVATRVGGIPEIIVDNDNGFLVERNDIDGMVSRVNLLIDDVSLRRAMGVRARQVVEEKFTSRPIKQVENLYDRVIAAA